MSWALIIFAVYILFQAAANGYTEIVTVLLSSNKVKDNIDLQDNKEETALIIGILKFKILLLFQYLISFLLQATRHNNSAVVEKLLKAGANPNIMKNKSENALLFGNYDESKYCQVLINFFFQSL